MPKPGPLPDAVKGPRPAVQTGASDLGLFAPTPMAIGAVGAVALATSTADAATGKGAAFSASESVAENSQNLSLSDMPLASASLPEAPALSIPIAPGLLTITVPGSSTAQVESPIVEGASAAIAPQSLGAASSVDTVDESLSPVSDIASPPGPAVAGTVSTDVSEAIAGIRATADQLNGAIEALVDRLGGSAHEAVGGTAGLVDAVGARIDMIADQADQAVAAMGERVGDSIANVTGTVAGLADTAASLLGESQASVADLTGGVADLTGGIADLTGGATATIGGTIDSALDLSEIGGTDPAGGIATLTALLSSSDGFELGAPDLPEPVFATVGDAAASLGEVGDDLPDLPIIDTPGLLGTTGTVLGGLFDDDGDGNG